MWDSITDALAMARAKCAQCGGHGKTGSKVCACAYRKVFKCCFNRYRKCKQFPDDRAYVERSGCGLSAGFRGAEYIADFTLTGKRLAGLEAQVFARHFLDGIGEPACSRLIGVDPGLFWHSVYRIQNELGRVMLERGLFPKVYFNARYVDSSLEKTPWVSKSRRHAAE